VQALEKDSELLAELRALHQAGCLLCSVCTGALVLAWAEVLKGKKATTHHLHKERLRNHCQVVDQRIVCDGNLITAAGVSASIDLGLHLLERFYGEETSDSVAQRLEYRR
jgi:transcriptional regulator GlxA family with amidase domain